MSERLRELERARLADPSDVVAAQRFDAEMHRRGYFVEAPKMIVTIRAGFGQIAYTLPWDGKEATLEWAREHAEPAGYALGGQVVSVVGWPPTRPLPQPSHP